MFSGDAQLVTDYSSLRTASVTVPAGSQSASFTLTGVDDALDETIETVSIALALQTDDEGNSVSNVELSSDVSLDIQISDDEAPVVSFTTSATEIPENNGSTVVTATLSNAKLEPTTVSCLRRFFNYIKTITFQQYMDIRILQDKLIIWIERWSW